MSGDAHTPMDDEIALGAWLDGELDPEAAASLARRLHAEPTLRARLAALREADAMARAAFVPMRDEPVPAALVATIRGAPAAGEAPTPPTIAPARFLRPHASRRWAPMALAAAIALLIGAGGGYWTGLGTGADGRNAGLGDATLAGAVAAGSVLARALETRPSYEVVEAEGLSAMAVATHVGEDGRVCREYELLPAAPSTDGEAGLACRESGGTWHRRAVVALGGPAGDGDEAGFAPASGGADPLARLVPGLRDATPLSPEREAALIEAGWPAGNDGAR
ncbi:MAG: hypothetical protein RID91_02915 [Azospirillaceae bacterium]